MFRLLGSGVAVVGVAVVGMVNAYDRSANYVEAEAEIFRIDRTCAFTVETKGFGRTSISHERKNCHATDEFAHMRGDEKRKMDVDGDATLKVSYTSPLDGKSYTGKIKVNGRDEEFYSLRVHDKVKILVSKADPEQVKLY